MIDNNLEAALTNSDLYLQVLEKRSQQNKVASKNTETLYPLLKNPDEVSQQIAIWLNTPDFELDQQKKIHLLTGEKDRTLYTAPWPDRILLMGVQSLLSEFLEPSYSSRLFSFRKGRGPIQAHQSFRNYLRKFPHPWIGKRDIAQYGETISKKILFQKLESLLPLKNHPKLYKILRPALSPRYLDESNILQTVENGLPAGSPLVPVLENLYLMNLDQRVDQFCKDDPSIFYARYGDDFIFASPDPETFKKISALVDHELQELLLTVAPEKKVDLKLGITHSYLEWLGASFSSHGLISFRPKHQRAFYQTLRHELKALLSDFAENSSLEESIPRIRTAIHQLMSDQSNPSLAKITLNKNDPTHLKILDQNIRIFLVRWLSATFKVKKSESWKVVRKLKIPSLNYQRRMGCHLK